MNTIRHSVLIILLIFAMFLSDISAYEYQKWDLPYAAKLRIGKGTVSNVEFSSDGNRLIVLSSIGIWIYDAHTGVELDLIPVNLYEAIGVSPNAQMYVERSSDHTVKVRSISDRSVMATLEGDNSDLHYVRFNLKENIIASDIGGEIRIWDISTGKLNTSIDLETDWIHDVVLSPDGTKLVSISNDVDHRVLQLWDVFTGSHIITLTKYAQNIRNIVFSTDSNTIISGSGNTVQIWEGSSGKRTLNFWTPDFSKIAVSPDGNKIVTSGYKGIDFWDMANGEHIMKLDPLRWGSHSIAFSPDGRFLAGGGSSELFVWDVDSGDRKLSISGHLKGVASIAIDPNGKLLASSDLYNIHLWDSNTGEFKQMIYGSGRYSIHWNLVFSPDGNTLGSIDYGAIRLWDIVSNTQIATIYKWFGHGQDWLSTSSIGYKSFAFSPDGQYIASGHSDHTIHLWYKGRTYIDALEGHTDAVSSIAFFHGNRNLVSGSNDGTVRLWDLDSRSSIETLTEHTDAVNCIALNRDESIVASGSDDNSIILRDTVSGNSKIIQTDHTDGVHILKFSNDGKTLVSCGHYVDPTIQIWDVTNEILISNITAHSYGGFVDFTSDGKTLITGSRDGTIIFWDYNLLISDDVETLRLAEDANGDGVVNLQDLIFVASQYGQVGDENTADVNGDGVINIADILLVAAALPNEHSAPSLYHSSDKVLNAKVVEQWLDQAQQINTNLPKFKTGINILTDLLASLRPDKTVLLSNYPNPFNPETWIPYQLSEQVDVTIRIYSTDGRMIRTLALGNQSAGLYHNPSRAAYWDGKNESGEPVASGLYYYTLTAGNYIETRRMVIRK